MRFRIGFSLSFLFFCFPFCDGWAEPRPEVREYIVHALNLIRSESVFSGSVNWEEIERSAFSRADQAMTTCDAWPVIRHILEGSGAIVLGEFIEPGVDNSVKSSVAGHGERGKDFLSAKMIARHVAYVRLKTPPCHCAEDYFWARRIHGLVSRIFRKNPIAWIIDLREYGDNLKPEILLSAFSIFFQTPQTTGGMTSKGKKMEPWHFVPVEQLRGITPGNQTNPMAQREKPTHLPVRIAVLVGPHTSFSGEVLAVALRSQKNVILVGAPTAGKSMGTRDYLLEDGARLRIINAILTDRDGRLHPGPVYPDIHLDANADSKMDPCIDKALEWIGDYLDSAAEKIKDTEDEMETSMNGKYQGNEAEGLLK